MMAMPSSYSLPFFIIMSHYMTVHGKPMRADYTCFLSEPEKAPPGYTKQQLRDEGLVAFERGDQVYIETCIF